jgi:hypothetical protein
MAEFAATSNNSPENAGNWERAMNDPDSLSFEERSALRGVMYKIFQATRHSIIVLPGAGIISTQAIRPSTRCSDAPPRSSGIGEPARDLPLNWQRLPTA